MTLCIVYIVNLSLAIYQFTNICYSWIHLPQYYQWLFISSLYSSDPSLHGLYIYYIYFIPQYNVLLDG